MKKIVTLVSGLLFSSQALADVTVAFLEGAPKDRFVVTNNGACDLSELSIKLDLSSSASGIIFDVTARGAGVEVFQPLEMVAGEHLVSKMPVVSDGDRSVTLGLSRFPSGETVAFTIDVDDTSGVREITVTNDEIRGATALLQSASFQASGTFEDGSALEIPLPSCS
ncbi:hypothetical protein [Aliiruegeria lutimaris]|uniref:Aggregation factor core n=1 Tax=Aliiruegeria lutimaris TaxID=571298 RepID=A0A1G9K7N6_9RHOB|nr:hypothetical protein [Aliiruegeria lutimaris]SDL45385.1 hypothetical protein SAMN04488026_108615 [Aliiruegeria lutimaris]